MNSLVLPLWAEILVAALLLVGAAFALVGSWALVKLSDFYRRLHGPSKATTLGVGCVLLASALVFLLRGDGSVHELLITLFLFITAPVSAHLLVKAALNAQPQMRPPLPSPRAQPTPAQGNESAHAPPPTTSRTTRAQ